MYTILLCVYMQCVHYMCKITGISMLVCPEDQNMCVRPRNPGQHLSQQNCENQCACDSCNIIKNYVHAMLQWAWLLVVAIEVNG